MHSSGSRQLGAVMRATRWLKQVRRWSMWLKKVCRWLKKWHEWLKAATFRRGEVKENVLIQFTMAVKRTITDAERKVAEETNEWPEPALIGPLPKPAAPRRRHVEDRAVEKYLQQNRDQCKVEAAKVVNAPRFQLRNKNICDAHHRPRILPSSSRAREGSLREHA